MSKVAVASYAVEGFRPEVNLSENEIVSSVAIEAYERAGLTHDDLDALVLVDQDAFDGAAISSGMKVTPAGGYNKPSMRIENGGGFGIHQAMSKILSEKADIVAVVAADTVRVDATVVSHISQEAIYTREFGQNHLQTFGLLASAHRDARSVSEADLAAVAEKNYAAAADNPHAHRREPYSAEEVLNSKRIVGPLHRLMVSPHSYGAAVIVLASEEAAADLDYDPVWLTGGGVSSSRYFYRDMNQQLEQRSQRAAAEQAYEMAGVGPDDIDAAEVCDPAPTFELLSYESLGFCEQGEATSLLTDGTTTVSGDLPVNPSGGVLATNPPNTGGIYRAIMGVKALEGGVADAECTLVADSDLHLGDQGRTDAVLILEGGAA